MINRVVLVGRITRDIDLRKTPNGASVVSFTLACNRRVKQQGQPDADFIPCVAWNKTADLMKQFVRKGALLGVEGRIQTRNYDDKDGKKVYVTEVIVDSVQFLEPRSASTQTNNAYIPEHHMGYMPDDHNDSSFDKTFAADTLDIASDDLPF